MADHHDDRVESALALLKSRQWAGAATNPRLETMFMRATMTERKVRFRLVLGVGALMACGLAAAAATRPAWRAVLLAEEPPAVRDAILAASPTHLAVAPEPPSPLNRIPILSQMVRPAAPAASDGPEPEAAAPPDDGRWFAAEGCGVFEDDDPIGVLVEDFLNGDQEAGALLWELFENPWLLEEEEERTLAQADTVFALVIESLNGPAIQELGGQLVIVPHLSIQLRQAPPLDAQIRYRGMLELLSGEGAGVPAEGMWLEAEPAGEGPDSGLAPEGEYRVEFLADIPLLGALMTAPEVGRESAPGEASGKVILRLRAVETEP